MIWRRHGGTVVAVVALAIFLYLLADTQNWSTRARLFSQVIVGPALALAAVQVAREALRSRAGRLTAGPAEAGVTRSAALWMAGFFASLLTFGFMTTVPIFTVAYLRFEARFSWLVSVSYAVVTVAFSWVVFGTLLHIALPKGVIGSSLPGIQ